MSSWTVNCFDVYELGIASIAFCEKYAYKYYASVYRYIIASYI